MDARMSDQEEALYLAILDGTGTCDPAHTQVGRDAYDAGVPFHEAPEPRDSVASLCWRFGWNNRALDHLASATR